MIFSQKCFEETFIKTMFFFMPYHKFIKSIDRFSGFYYKRNNFL